MQGFSSITHNFKSIFIKEKFKEVLQQPVEWKQLQCHTALGNIAGIIFAHAILVFHGAKHKSVQEVFEYTGTTVNGSQLVPLLWFENVTDLKKCMISW